MSDDDLPDLADLSSDDMSVADMSDDDMPKNDPLGT